MTATSALSAIPPRRLRQQLALRVDGRVSDVVGLVIQGTCPGAAVGDLIELHPSGSPEPVMAEVVGLANNKALMVPLGDVRGLAIGDRLSHLGVRAAVPCSEGLLGRIVDPMGQPIDGRGSIPGPTSHRPIYADPPPALSRRRIDQPLAIGVRAIDGLLTLGQGQRVGIFAGAGVGKSRLLGMLTRSAVHHGAPGQADGTSADVCVVALIGERGREVVDFVEEVLPPEARSKTVVVVATSDQSPLFRTRGAFVATAMAEHFCAQGRQVLLVMDSLTRFSMAGRELGLAAGEPPATKGYTPSVFAALPRLLERAGRFRDGGSITGAYTVLVEGDDLSDPIADAARSILDGHIVLSRDLAKRGHFPAIDVLASVSRVADAVLPDAQAEIAARFRERLADLREVEELVSIGAYVPGASPALDRALQSKSDVLAFLRQAAQETTPFALTVKRMSQLVTGGAA